MKISLFIASFLIFLFTLAIQTADARSGCCSHHGGVCGCGCCDGSPLSAICAPYYPQCSNATNAGSSAVTNTDQPTQATLSTIPQTKIMYAPRPTATPTEEPTSTPTET